MCLCVCGKSRVTTTVRIANVQQQEMPRKRKKSAQQVSEQRVRAHKYRNSFPELKVVRCPDDSPTHLLQCPAAVSSQMSLADLSDKS